MTDVKLIVDNWNNIVLPDLNGAYKKRSIKLVTAVIVTLLKIEMCQVLNCQSSKRAFIDVSNARDYNYIYI